MAENMQHWVQPPRPGRRVLAGRYVRLEPFDAAAHLDGLFAASSVAEAGARFAWLFETAADDRAVFDQWFARVAASDDPLFFAVVDAATGRVTGRQTLMRIDAPNGVVEVGNIYWGPAMARTRLATEALFLFARHVFDDLGYRRLEWKCNDQNAPSKQAARRFGFAYEGLFRQHMIVKGHSRDTAWFAMTDKDWPALRAGYEAWLDPANFDAQGQQRQRLDALTARA